MNYELFQLNSYLPYAVLKRFSYNVGQYSWYNMVKIFDSTI